MNYLFVITDGSTVVVIRNGHKMMSTISGTGCMLSSIIGGFIGANREDILKACVGAVCAMGLCGELAYKKLSKDEGNLTYKNKIFDEMFHLTKEKLEEGAKYEVR